MREIKFRAWDKQDRRMITHEQDFIPLKVTNLGVLRLNPNIEKDNWEFMNRDRFYLMQHTGLKDRNGKEIYEGDIIKYNDYVVDPETDEVYDREITGVIKYNEEYQTLDILVDEKRIDEYWIVRTSECEVEVIGNIYENEELLV